jgi:hypothetical protein
MAQFLLPSTVIIDSRCRFSLDVKYANLNKLQLWNTVMSGKTMDGLRRVVRLRWEEIFPYKIRCGIELQAKPAERPRIAFPDRRPPVLNKPRAAPPV